jgi:predicted 3-demethylubiquinone-9 3-methyltransferase (glyoxalase superfamily)
MHKISSCLWFEGQAEEAARLYTSLFKNSKLGRIAHYPKAGAEVTGQKAGSVMTVEFEIEGHQVLGLNGSPIFKHTPAMSFFVWCDSEAEIDRLWKSLSPGGQIRMGLDKYPWAPKYGWTTDKYSIEWQFMLSDKKGIAPAMLFVDKLFGKGEEALNFYMSLFKESKVETLSRDEANKAIMHAQFKLAGQDFCLMEGQGTHGFSFTEAFSLTVNCDDQNEVDYYWDKFTREGGQERPCGWVKDRFGVFWQITPKAMGRLMSDPDPATRERVFAAMLTMKKFDIATLERAASQK